MKRKFMLFAAFGAMLASCNGGGEWIDCYSVNGNSYYVIESSVFEYKSESGACIYTSFDNYSKLNVYKSRLSGDFVSYDYVRLVGYLTRESNYRLNLATRTIDKVTKYLKYDLAKYADKEGIDNNEAYALAKKGYYSDYLSLGNASGIFLDIQNSSLEKHAYTVVSADEKIAYYPMPY